MTYRTLPLEKLEINRANDRHGELENETAAIGWLFHNREQHMRNLAKDIVANGKVFEPPLVWPNGGKFVVHDGNRRVTCLKLLSEPNRAPTIELQDFFEKLHADWKGKIPKKILCQIEEDRDGIDDILFRRHTGTQGGIGQTTWDDRMKLNFVARTGKGSSFNVADEIEKRLVDTEMLPNKIIPRSTLNRLLSAEPFRNRVGFSIRNRKFFYTHEEPVVLAALSRIADDLANGEITLADVWDVDSKRAYLDKLENEQMLPSAAHALKTPSEGGKSKSKPTPKTKSKPSSRTTLIPQVTFAIAWAGRLQRHRTIWEELQYKLKLKDHPNAISVLFRVLFELSVENYIKQVNLTTIKTNDTLAKRALRVAEDLFSKGKIDQKYLGVFKKFQTLDPLVSMDTFNRYVHSNNFAPSPEHLSALWDSLADFIVHCLNE